jgi:hypothetical protein
MLPDVCHALATGCSELEPWLLITDWPVTDAESTLRIFGMYRQRWAVEDSFKFTFMSGSQKFARGGAWYVNGSDRRTSTTDTSRSSLPVRSKWQSDS